jgi:hypothetical protein
MSNKKNIALIGFPGDYFHEFALSLQSVGFNIYWVCTTDSMFEGLKRRQGVKKEFLINLFQDFNPETIDINISRFYLSNLESPNYPTFNDIILMDRILRKKNTEIAIKFLNHIAVKLEYFFKENHIQLINSGRDSAIQLTSMLVAKKMNIKWVVPTRMRIPKNMYGFCSTHETNSFIKISKPDSNDYDWADKFLTKYLYEDIKPELKVAAMNFFDIFKLIPIHFKIFCIRFKESILDLNNTYTRYTIYDIITMYFNRRINMLKVIIFKPFEYPELNNPYALYTLHTQPESSIDVCASFFSNQIETIKLISRCLPITHELYVKVHPTDVDGKNISFYKSIREIPSVKLIHYKCNTKILIEKADLIFSLTGTAALESGLRNKKVITFANNFFNVLPTINYCSDLKELPQLIKKILYCNPATDNRKKIVEFLADMKASCFEGEINRDYGSNPSKLTHEDLKKLTISYTVLFNNTNKNL